MITRIPTKTYYLISLGVVVDGRIHEHGKVIASADFAIDHAELKHLDELLSVLNMSISDNREHSDKTK